MGPILIYCRIFPLAGCCTYRCLGYVEQVVGYGNTGVAGGVAGLQKKLPSHRCGTILLVATPLDVRRLILSDTTITIDCYYWVEIIFLSFLRVCIRCSHPG